MENKKVFEGISKDKFSNKLRMELFNASKNDIDNKQLSNLFKLVDCELTDDSIKELLNYDNFSFPKIKIDNIEILAKINDAKFILGDTDKLNCIQKSVEYYIQIYDQINDLKYLIRALELVRKVKSIFKKRLLKLEEKILQIFPLLESPYYKLRLIENSLFLIQQSSFKDLIDYALVQLNNSYENNDYRNAENYITILNKLRHFNNNESKIQQALCLEKKGDFYISQKEPNTYYPTILTTYTEALKEVKGISINGEFKTRLEQKIKIEQRNHSEMLKKAGIPFQSELNINEIVRNENIEDFKTGLNFILQLPIIETEKLKSKNKEKDKNTFLGHFFKDYLHITNKGTVSGKSNEEDFYFNISKDYYRNSLIKILREIKLIMDFDKQISKDVISTMVINSESLFIPKGREYFFIEGIYQGFQNNFILASHILIPQIENSLKNLIELNGRNATKNTEEIQNDNTLGSILGIEKNNKMLDKICSRNLLLELNSYLVDGNSVNFRNRLCHGLISPLETDYYGIYLWWLTIKMIMQTEKYFETPK
ncbi:hypothetical protein BTO15_00155 [Polaribacter sejongensis]|uniref:DUF4209 domain-containing protein n=1 Tax=Polaribacter sejongensis TaxID=985043 RepID=A0ABM6PVE4_9FLAO|nr:DUF4209 domain-containing protein [Polaribacter sejongensis]AUC20621.1 hypothetical protein BTO15_00155 [Polaribacter sejongensis]